MSVDDDDALSAATTKKLEAELPESEISMFTSYTSKRALRFVLCVTLLVAATLSGYGQHFTRTNLTTNFSSLAPRARVDANLVNSWGLAFSSSSLLWVADNGTGVATVYDGNGSPQSLVVTIPGPTQGAKSTPTGTVYNYTSAFRVSGRPAVFLFVTEDGTIAGWNPAANPTRAIIAVNRSGSAVYKGCAIAQSFSGPRFYATNFRTGSVDVFDAGFRPVGLGNNAFRVPGLDRRFAPFNIQSIGANLVVTFAFRQPGSTDEQHAPGLGFVAIFDVNGRLLQRFQQGGFLNAPWGIALAPNGFGVFAHRLLIGNFGDGTIHAFNMVTGAFEGTLLAPNNQAITIDGLWALQFGNNANNASAQSLFFTSGPNDENNGLLGRLTPVAAEQRGTTE